MVQEVRGERVRPVTNEKLWSFRSAAVLYYQDEQRAISQSISMRDNNRPETT